MTPQDAEPQAQADGEPRSMVSELAEAVVDGVEIDWREVESVTGAGDLPVVKALREVETVLGAHREVLAEKSASERRPPPLRTGDHWAHLEIRSYLGGGGFGDVYEAFDPRIERASALKILDAPEASDEALLQEARLLAKINHPNVVKVYGADRLEGRVGISMELLEGHTLSDELDQYGPMSADDAVVIGMKLCDALAEVHRKGIVHRDVKAQNVMRAHGGRVVLMDFGIGLEASAGESARPAGTPAYQAPELLAGGAPGVASDVYALGVLLFHLVTANFPVRGSSMKEFRERHEAGEVAHLRDLRPGLPEAFVRVVEKALEPDPSQRFRSAGAFHRALSRAMESSVLSGRTTGRPGGWRRLLRNAAVYGVVWAAIFGSLYWYFWPKAPDESARVLLAPLVDRSGEDLFAVSADAALRSKVRSSPGLEAVPEALEVRVSREMRREDPGAPFSSDELQEAAVRTDSVGILGGEILPVGNKWILRLWLEPLGENGLREVAEEQLLALSNASLDRAVESAVAALADQAKQWLRPGGPLRRSTEPLQAATTSSLDALRLYSTALRAYSDGDIEASETAIRRALELDPDFALARLQFGHSLAAQGNPEAALRAVERAFELRERTSSEFERLTIEGAYSGVVRQYRAAIRAYQQVLDIVGEDPTTLRQLAIAYRELGQFDQAVRLARRARNESDDRSINHGFLVYTLATAGFAEEALYESAEIRATADFTHYLLLSEALAYLVLDRPADALASTEAIAAKGDLTYKNLASWMVARIRIYQGDLDGAAKVLYSDRRTDAVEGTKFLEMRRRYWAARLHWLEGRKDEALKVLRSIDLPIIPSHMTGWRSVAILQAELGDVDGAREILKGLEDLRQKYPSLLADLVTSEVEGAVLTAEGRPAEALRALVQGEAQSDVSFLRSLARAQVGLGDLERAVYYDELLLDRRGELLDGEFAGLWVEALVRRARCLERLGRSDEAEAAWTLARARWGSLADRAFGQGGSADALPDAGYAVVRD